MDTGNALIYSLVYVIEIVLNLYMWVLIVGAVMSWLIAFGIINRGSRAVAATLDFIQRVTEPLLRPIRRKVPPVNGIDLSPLILILVIIFLRIFLWRLAI